MLRIYGYVEKKYLVCRGKEGVNIVVINQSSGFPNQKPKDNTLLCDVYDRLGKLGILSVCVSPNRYIDIEEDGDLPIGCESNYIIGLTYTDPSDNKAYNSGFGKKSVDLGVPGEQLYTTFPGSTNNYKNFNGNSAAGPLLAGAISLLYSLPNFRLDSLSLFNPEQIALLIRSSIFNGVDRVGDLEKYTATGGRLNVLKSYNYLRSKLNSKQFKSDLIKTYLNTANDLIIEGFNFRNEQDKVNIALHNGIGQRVLVSSNHYTMSSPIYIKLNNLVSGVYYVSMESGGESFTKKIIINR